MIDYSFSFLVAGLNDSFFYFPSDKLASVKISLALTDNPLAIPKSNSGAEAPESEILLRIGQSEMAPDAVRGSAPDSLSWNEPFILGFYPFHPLRRSQVNLMFVDP